MYHKKDLIGEFAIILGITAGMVVSLLQIDFPDIIDKTTGNLAMLATPLALIGLGAGFEGKKRWLK